MVCTGLSQQGSTLTITPQVTVTEPGQPTGTIKQPLQGSQAPLPAQKGLPFPPNGPVAAAPTGPQDAPADPVFVDAAAPLADPSLGGPAAPPGTAAAAPAIDQLQPGGIVAAVPIADTVQINSGAPDPSAHSLQPSDVLTAAPVSVLPQPQVGLCQSHCRTHA